MELSVQNIFQQLKPFWQISFQCRRSYQIVMLMLIMLYFFGFVIMTHTMFHSEQPQFIAALIYRAFCETALFAIVTHFLLRPYLKLVLLPQGKFGWNILPYAIYTFVLGVVVTLISLQLTKFSPFGQIDFSNVTVQDPHNAQSNLTLHMSMASVILMGGINLAMFYWMWALPYVFWHTLISKKQIQHQMREAQLQQLTNQLNPHFLFNALNSIRALIFEDQEKAAHTLTQLSELFRVHLQAHLKPTSTLEDEWQIAKRYLEIEQVRLEQRLQLQLSFDESLWQQHLPTLCLLTLVENAIKHGISPSDQTGIIEITSQRIEPGRWQLRVNNSVGADSCEKSTHTGLANLQQRLQLLSPLHQLYYRKPTDRFELTMELADDQNLNR
jgi:two-component system sensor histidine kinase AlgZ